MHKFSFVSQFPGVIEVDPKKGKTKKGFVHMFEKMILVTVSKGSKLIANNVFPVSKVFMTVPVNTPKGMKKCIELINGDESVVIGLTPDIVIEFQNAFEKLKGDAQ